MTTEIVERLYPVSVVGTTGDVSVTPSIANPGTPNLTIESMIFGGVAAGGSTVAFFRFDVDVPKGAIIRRVNFEMDSAGGITNNGATAFVGQLVRDGKWDRNGFNVADYPFHSSYPAPHNGLNGDIIPGRITNDAYLGSFFFIHPVWPFLLFPAESVSIGSAAYSPTFVVEGLRAAVQALVLEVDYNPSDVNSRGIAFVLASTDHIAGDTEFGGMYTQEEVTQNPPFLRIEYGGNVKLPTAGKNLAQVGDVLLRQTDNGGEIRVTNGLVEMTGRLEVAAYLSLFGGNEDDDGRPDSRLGYWGNLIETDEAFKLVSRTQHLLRSIPVTTANIQRLRRVAIADLEWFVQTGVASSVEVAVAVTGVNRVAFTISIRAEGEEHRFTFTENWKAAA